MIRSKFVAFACAAASLPAAAGAASFTFVPGDLVLSLTGNVDGSGPYGDNQASPIALQQITAAGADAGRMYLPQVTTSRGGVTQYAVSGEYGSSSEGLLQRSADGRSLVIAGYAIDAATYNRNAVATYGNAALAQSTSVPGGAVTPVARAVALIGADGTVDTSTALLNVANTNNPRSVATVDGSSFYVAGQGKSGDTTQGVFLANRGASSATPIDTAFDARDVAIVGGQLYLTADSKQSGAGSTGLSTLGTGLPTAAVTAVPMAGIGAQIATLTAAQGNGVNSSRVGNNVYLSPEQFFFANATTLYVADAGAPKNGSAGKAGIGDGGLQKWLFANGSWSLAYTLSAGLNLVDNSTAAGTGTTGLIGLTGQVSGGAVSLYATNYTIGDLDQSYVYAITDDLAATSRPVTESFAAIYTAAAGTKVRGVAFAPTLAAAVPEPAGWATMLAGFGFVGGALRRRDRGGVAAA